MSKHISIQDLENMLRTDDHLQMVDVRSSSEFSSGHIPAAVNVPMDEIESRLDDLRKVGTVVLVCQSGSRAALTCDLIQAKRPDVQILEGGTTAWVEAGLPVVATSRTRWSLERQVRLMAGFLVFTGIMLSLFVHPNWLILSGFVSVGLMFAGLTNLCPMAIAFSKMPWNRPAQEQATPHGAEGAKA